MSLKEKRARKIKPRLRLRLKSNRRISRRNIIRDIDTPIVTPDGKDDPRMPEIQTKGEVTRDDIQQTVDNSYSYLNDDKINESQPIVNKTVQDYSNVIVPTSVQIANNNFDEKKYVETRHRLLDYQNIPYAGAANTAVSVGLPALAELGQPGAGLLVNKLIGSNPVTDAANLYTKYYHPGAATMMGLVNTSPDIKYDKNDKEVVDAKNEKFLLKQLGIMGASAGAGLLAGGLGFPNLAPYAAKGIELVLHSLMNKLSN